MSGLCSKPIDIVFFALNDILLSSGADCDFISNSVRHENLRAHRSGSPRARAPAPAGGFGEPPVCHAGTA